MLNIDEQLKRQMEIDAELMFKLRGYCLKCTNSINDLPNNNAYSTLETLIYRENFYKEGCGRHDVAYYKTSFYRIGHLANKIQYQIHQNGGKKYKDIKSKLTDKEIAIRIAGEYSHKSSKPPALFEFTPSSAAAIKKFISDDSFIKLLQEDINSYLYEDWDGRPNREDDLDRLNTLKGQIERLIDHWEGLIEIVVAKRYCNIDLILDYEDLGGHIKNVWELFHFTNESILSITEASRSHRSLEQELAENVAHLYKEYSKKSPSKNNTDFMEIIQIITSAVNQTRKPALVIGERVLKKAIDSIKQQK